MRSSPAQMLSIKRRVLVTGRPWPGTVARSEVGWSLLGPLSALLSSALHSNTAGGKTAHQLAQWKPEGPEEIFLICPHTYVHVNTDDDSFFK